MGSSFDEGVRLFNDQEFFEAHEVWEDLWKKTSGPDRNFYQGLIQVTSALHHLKKGNMKGARVLHDSAWTLLNPYGLVYGGIDLKALNSTMTHVLSDILSKPLQELAGRHQPDGFKIPWHSALAFKMPLAVPPC